MASAYNRFSRHAPVGLLEGKKARGSRERAVGAPRTSSKRYRHHMEQALQRRLAFDEVLNKILGRFATCAAPEMGAAVEDALRAVAEFIGADHAYVVIFSADRKSWSAAHEWCAPHVAARYHSHQNLPLGTKPWNEAKILAGEVVRIDTLSDYPPQARRERARDAAEGALSILSVPIRGRAGLITGCVGLHSHARAIRWSDPDIARLKMAGDAIASLLERQRAEQALRESEARYRAVVEFSPECIAVTVDDRLVYLNPAGIRLAQLSPADLNRVLGRSIYDFVPRPLHGLVRESRRRVIQRRMAQPLIEGALVRDNGSTVSVEAYNVPFVFDGRPAVLSLIHDISARKRAEECVRELSHRLHRAQDEERRRIARELHDSAAQHLAAVMMNLGLLTDLLPKPERRVAKLFAESVDLIERCSQEIRTVSYLLHPPLLDQMGLAAALRSYVDGFARRSGIRVVLDLGKRLPRFPDEIELALFRVVQEGLGNIHRHSGSRTARVGLAIDRAGITLRVSDQGLGMPAHVLRAVRNGSGTQGVGLAAMQERLRELGGRLELDSTPAGTRLQAFVPRRPLKP